MGSTSQQDGTTFRGQKWKQGTACTRNRVCNASSVRCLLPWTIQNQMKGKGDADSQCLRCHTHHFFKKASSSVTLASPTLLPVHYHPTNLEWCWVTSHWRHTLRGMWALRQTSGHLDAQFLKSVQAFPSLNSSWEVTLKFSNRWSRHLDDCPTPGGVLSNSMCFGLGRMGSQWASRIKTALVCFWKLTGPPLEWSCLR